MKMFIKFWINYNLEHDDPSLLFQLFILLIYVPVTIYMFLREIPGDFKKDKKKFLDEYEKFKDNHKEKL